MDSLFGLSGLIEAAPKTGDKIALGGSTTGRQVDLDALAGYMFSAADTISVTGATTARFNRWHVVSGTSADYQITLPRVEGNNGKFVGFRFQDTTALSKIITLKTSGSNGILTPEGVLTTDRLYTAGEMCLLSCDGSQWQIVFETGGMSASSLSGGAGSSTIDIAVGAAWASLLAFDITGSTSANTLIRTSADGGSTFAASAGNYGHGRVAWATGSGPTQAGSASDTSITGMGSVTRFAGWLMTINPGASEEGLIFGFLEDVGGRAANNIFGVRISAAAVTHIRFLRSSGTMTGIVRRYKLR